MAVNVETTIVIDRPRAEVADYAGDPDHAPTWYENIVSVAWPRARRASGPAPEA